MVTGVCNQPVAQRLDAPVAARVLVVDDEEGIRAFLEQALREEGYVVDAAADAQEALALAGEHEPGLAVLDIMLPDRDGDELAGELRARCGTDMPVLVITAGSFAAEKARRAGAFAYLRKPFDLDQLLKLVQQGLAA